MISFAALALLAFQGPSLPPKPASDAVLATIDGKPLTAAEVEPYLWAWKTRETVSTLAIYRGIAAEARKRSVTVTDAEVKAKVDEQIATAKAALQPGQSLDDAVARYGGVPGLNLAIRNTLLLDKLAEKEFDPNGYAKLSIILFRTSDDKPPVVTAAKNANVAYASLQAGKPWDVVEKANEKEPRLLQTNGLIGWTAISALPEGARAQLATLMPSGYTTPIQTPAGLAIFRLNLRGKDAPATELAPFKAQALDASRKAVLTRIQAASKVEFKG